MSAWVALLRGINVGGVNIKSAELAGAFKDHGLAGVKTVLATGNVLFEADYPDPLALRGEIERFLSSRFGYEARVVLEERGRMAQLVDAYPYAEGPSHHAYVVFASDPQALRALEAEARERGIAVDPAVPGAAGGSAAGGGAPLREDEERVCLGPGSALFWACPRGSSTSTAFSALTAAARHKRALTTRNLNTVRKLVG